MKIVFDIETDGLLDTVTKIHCLSYKDLDTGELASITDYNEMIDLLDACDTIIGHNIIKYDIPVIKKLLDWEYPNEVVDTLGISYYLYPNRKRHGLEMWGEELGIAKPKVDDWENLSVQEYIHRCEEDVKINTALWEHFEGYLNLIYDGKYDKMIKYLNFKLTCLRDQEQSGVDIDWNLCHRTKHELEYVIQEKTQALIEYMPKQIEKTPPKVMYKKNGELSVHGSNWITLLKQRGLPEDSEVIYKDGNPSSHKQLKEWLFSLGWVPQTYKTNDKGEEIPQVSLPMGAGLCDSVKDLFEENPHLEALQGLYLAEHRLGIMKAFQEHRKDNKLYAKAHGFTNTLRLTHSVPLVNLPGVSKDYGKEVRGCMTVPDDDHIMIGSDISGLEDNTKQHYIYFFDPQYVEDMRVPGFDAHIDIALLAGIITAEEEKHYKAVEAKEIPSDSLYKGIKNKRHTGKTTNFSATYGAGGPKIAKAANISVKEGYKLHKIYWERNKAVKQTAESLTVKVVEYKGKKQKWLYNPVARLWYFLKAEKDRFSTLNQGTGCYVFDTWLSFIYKLMKDNNLDCFPVFQYHDECLIVCKKEHEEIVSDILTQAMEKVNKILKLNVEIGISIDVGNNYAECH